MTMTLTEFNTAPEESARVLLGAVLDIDEYVREMTARRPFADVSELAVASERAAGRITWPQVAGALARHPRIGEKPKPAGNTPDSAWSAKEQSGVKAEQVDDFAAGNAAYEERFGFIFLICATGLSGDQMLTTLRSRLGNDELVERPIVISELQKIAALRLAKAIQP